MAQNRLGIRAVGIYRGHPKADGLSGAAVTMLSVAVKSEQAQGAAVVFRIRELLIRQRTHSKNALGGHIAQFDEVVPQWAANAPRLIVLIEDPATILPEMPRDILHVLVMTLCQRNLQISALDAEIKRHAHENATARRLMTIPLSGM